MNILSVQGAKRGFTIVELLIVIAVIGILAAISIISYTGVQQRARDTAVLSDADAVSSEITRYSVKNNGSFGSAVVWYSEEGANSNIEITPSAGNVIDVVATSTVYCVRVFNSGSSQYKTLASAYSTGTGCSLLAASSAAIAGNAVPNGGVVTSFSVTTGAKAIAITPSNEMYILRSGEHCIHKVDASGQATLYAGVCGTAGHVSGPIANARFFNPEGLYAGKDGALYVVDQTYSTVRRIKDGVVTVKAGASQGYVEGTGAAARFRMPWDLVGDADGNLYVADRSNFVIRKITSSGVVTTLAGNGIEGFANGQGTAAQFAYPRAIEIDSQGNLYVVDSANHAIRKVTPSGLVTTLAGSGVDGFADGTGSAAQFSSPRGIVIDAAGVIYVADTGNNRIRKVTQAGVVTTLAGSIQGFVNGTGADARFNMPGNIDINSSGSLFVVESSRIREIK